MKQPSAKRWSPYARMPSSRKRLRRTLADVISRDTCASRTAQESQPCQESSPPTMKLDGEVTLKRKPTVRRKRQEPLEEVLSNLEQSQYHQEQEETLLPSRTLSMREQQTLNSLRNTQTRWPSFQGFCTWCGQLSCPMMCFATSHLLSQDQDGSLTSPPSWPLPPTPESSIGDGSESETSESLTSLSISSLDEPLSSLVENMLISTMLTPINPSSSLIGLDVQRTHSPTALLNNSRMDTSSPQSMNPEPSGSQSPML